MIFIGNFCDIILCVLDILRLCDFILCEDIWNSRKLLSYYEIYKVFWVFYDYLIEGVVEDIIECLKVGEVIVLISDVGMLFVLDLGFLLVCCVWEE